MGAIVLIVIVGMIGIGALITAIIAFTVIRSRRNSRTGPVNSGVGTYVPHMGYAPPQPIYPPAQQSYPSTPYQGYPAPQGTPPPYPNPYLQQPPHEGQ